jgi:hypothetical protein
VRASAAAYGAAAEVPIALAPTSGVITAATTTHTAPLGPSTSCRQVPKMGYARTPAKAAYSPYCTGTPASVA